MRLVERPELMFGHHGDRREHDGSISPPFDAERLPCEALAERDLAALADNLDLDVADGGRAVLHAIMPRCGAVLFFKDP